MTQHSAEQRYADFLRQLGARRSDPNISLTQSDVARLLTLSAIAHEVDACNEPFDCEACNNFSTWFWEVDGLLIPEYRRAYQAVLRGMFVKLPAGPIEDIPIK